MSDELKDFLDSLEGQQDDSGLLKMLVSETILWRDKLKEETGEILTVLDTRVALDALEAHVHGREPEADLTEPQGHLVERWLERLDEIQKERDAAKDE